MGLARDPSDVLAEVDEESRESVAHLADRVLAGHCDRPAQVAFRRVTDNVEHLFDLLLQLASAGELTFVGRAHGLERLLGFRGFVRRGARLCRRLGFGALGVLEAELGAVERGVQRAFDPRVVTGVLAAHARVERAASDVVEYGDRFVDWLRCGVHQGVDAFDHVLPLAVEAFIAGPPLEVALACRRRQGADARVQLAERRLQREEGVAELVAVALRLDRAG